MKHEFHPNDGMLIRPDRLAPSAWSGHIPFGAWLVAALRPRLLVELGTHHGASYLAFCQAVREHGLDTRCLAVDTWEGDEHAGAYSDEVYDTLRRYHDPLYGAFSELLRMTFDDALGSVADGSVDLLHIDGLHTYDAVSHDFHSWRAKLSNRAVVLFHDTQVRDRDFGVWRFWDEVRREHPSFEFLHSHGLGVLLVGDDLPDDIRALAKLDDAQTTQVQHLFARLGEGVAARTQAEALEAALAGREQGVALYREHATALESQVSALQRDHAAAMTEFQREREALATALSELRPQADAMRREITDLQHRTVGLQNDVASREAGLEAWRTQAHALEQRVSALAAESAAAHAALEESRAATQATIAAHERLTAELAQRHAEAVDALVRQHAEASEALLTRLDDANAHLRTTSIELERILHSRSWRATAWMRRLSTMLRGSA